MTKVRLKNNYKDLVQVELNAKRDLNKTGKGLFL
jgi:hypothetical protein